MSFSLRNRTAETDNFKISVMAKLVVLRDPGDALAKPQTQPTFHQNPGEKHFMNLGEIRLNTG